MAAEHVAAAGDLEWAVALAFAAEHPEETARLLEQGDPVDLAAVLARLPTAVAAEVYGALNPSPAAAVAVALDERVLAAIVEALPMDVAAVTLRRVGADRAGPVLASVSAERRARLSSLLSFPEDSAGALADPLVLALRDDTTVAEAQLQLRGSQHHLFYYVYVVARDGRLAGTLALPELMEARPSDALGSVMRRDLVALDASTDRATLAAHPAWRDFDALPVVDTDGRLIGAIRHKTIRQLGSDPGRPVMATIVGLSELYWVGLSGILASLAPPRAVGEEAVHG
ncbi:MAG: CBS domain-containing protein [Gemmatimonadota bacterium]